MHYVRHYGYLPQEVPKSTTEREATVNYTVHLGTYVVLIYINRGPPKHGSHRVEAKRAVALLVYRI